MPNDAGLLPLWHRKEKVILSLFGDICPQPLHGQMPQRGLTENISVFSLLADGRSAVNNKGETYAFKNTKPQIVSSVLRNGLLKLSLK